MSFKQSYDECWKHLWCDFPHGLAMLLKQVICKSSAITVRYSADAIRLCCFWDWGNLVYPKGISPCIMGYEILNRCLAKLDSCAVMKAIFALIHDIDWLQKPILRSVWYIRRICYFLINILCNTFLFLRLNKWTLITAF